MGGVGGFCGVRKEVELSGVCGQRGRSMTRGSESRLM